MKISYYAAKAVRQEEDPIVCAIDTETRGLGGELLMCQWGVFDQIYISTSETMVSEMFECVLQYPRPCVWYSHFAQYDWRYFLDYLANCGHPVEIGMRTDTDIYEIRIENEEGEIVILRDSWALWAHPLEKLANIFCPEIPKLEIDIENFDPKNPAHIEYAKRDVAILMVGLPRLFDLIGEHFGVCAGATAAGTALKAWQKSLEYNVVYDCSDYGEREEFIRQAYYGGLVFLTDTSLQRNVKTYDINSSYPSEMCAKGVPYGRISPVKGEYFEDDPGIYRVRVKAPDNLIVPILPARDHRGSMRWFKGEFETCVTNVEINFALEHGYELIEVYEGLLFEEMVYPFDDMVEHCKFLRDAYKGTATEMVAKLLQNALYGKFGTRRERIRMMHYSSMEEEDFLGAVACNENGEWYTKKELDGEMRCLPQWAVFITAHARIKLLTTIYAIGPENVIYGDTDSITIKDGFDHLVDSGNNYGQWKLEKEWLEFRAIAPKVYSGILKSGKRMGAAKGLPRKGVTDDNWKELLEEGSSKAVTMSLDSLRVSMKKGVKPARPLIRKSSDLTKSSNFISLPDGKVDLKYQGQK